MYTICFFSSIFSPFSSPMRSSVSVVLEVSTMEERVDMDAASTSTMTRLSSSGVKSRNMAGMMASYPLADTSTWPERSRPKPPMK